MPTPALPPSPAPAYYRPPLPSRAQALTGAARSCPRPSSCRSPLARRPARRKSSCRDRDRKRWPARPHPCLIKEGGLTWEGDKEGREGCRHRQEGAGRPARPPPLRPAATGRWRNAAEKQRVGGPPWQAWHSPRWVQRGATASGCGELVSAAAPACAARLTSARRTPRCPPASTRWARP